MTEDMGYGVVFLGDGITLFGIGKGFCERETEEEVKEEFGFVFTDNEGILSVGGSEERKGTKEQWYSER